MTTSPTSYLQTLANDEAIAFIASLQRVKAHLSQELQWMNAQLQQKTVQFQGIETLLSEASALGLATAHPIPEAAPLAIGLESSAAVNGSTSPGAATDALSATIAALPVKPSSTQQPGAQGKAPRAKPSGGAKPSTKTSTTKAKQPKPSAPTAGKVGQRGKSSGLQRFLQSQFRDKSLTESVGDILNRASTPLAADDVMAELYDGLSKEDYQRAKNSVTNILSVGRSKGVWKSTGRGRYAGNAVTTA